jgi:PAS domain S-box-containing protein
VDHARAHEALHTLQLDAARSAEIFRTARDAIISIDRAGTVTLFNPAAEDIFGYAAGEVLGRNVQVLMPPPYRESHDRYIRSYQETGEAKAIGRIRYVEGQRKDGRVFPIELSVSEARVGDDVIYTAIVRDVTERRRIEADLQARVRQQAAIAELSLSALRHDLTAVMSEAVALTARTLEVEYCKILELLPDRRTLYLRTGVGWPEGVAGRATVGAGRTESQAGYTLASGAPVIVDDARAEARFRPAPLLRDHRALSGVSVVIPGRERPFGVLGAHAVRRRTFTRDDVHFLQATANLLGEAIERRRAERRTAAQYAVTRALAASSCLAEAVPRLLAAICEGVGWQLGELWTLDDGAGVLRREGEWHARNLDAEAFAAAGAARAFRRGEGLPGRTLEQGVPAMISDVSVEPSFNRRGEAARAGLRGGYAFPIWTGAEAAGVLAFFTTEVSPPDADLLALLDSLGRQIGDFIVRKRAEESLRVSQELALRHERLAELGAIAAKIVHDLGNPLAGLLMQAQLILRRARDDDTRPIGTVIGPAEQIVATARRLDALIRGFKGFARERRLEIGDVHLPRLLRDIVAFWEAEAAERGITLTLEAPEEAPPVRGDADQLRRVLDNLLKNAIEAIDRGPGAVGIAMSMPSPERVRISIEDTGPGVPETLDVFGLFQTTKPQGTGLGLAIAKQIVMLHGGGIELGLRAPHGAAFHIDLPRRGPAL